jgi:hypothetical protein
MEFDSLGSRRPGQDLAAHYSRLLTKQAASRLTMREFAALHGVSACTLYFWRRRLAAEGGGVQAASGTLAAVDVVGSARAPDAAPVGYEVLLTNGVHLRVPHDFAASRVAELLSVMRSC